MNGALIQRAFLIFIITCVSCLGHAQKLTGIWRGYFITEDGEQYKLEFQVQQAKSLAVTGVSYSYLDKRFYGKASMTGFFALKDKAFQIQETHTTEVRNMGGGGTCLMNYKFSYIKSGKEEFLEGTYIGKSEDREDPKNNGVWGDCGGGKVYLRRAQTSDFYVEPFLREQPVAKKVTPSKPIAKKPPVNTKTVIKQAPAKPPVAKVPAKKETAVPQKTTTVSKEPAIVQEEPKKAIVPKKIVLPAQTRSRTNELVRTLDVTSPEITIKIYDNGEIDGDTISVYLDDKVVLSQKRLTASPLILTIGLTEENPEHILVMVAENLGAIPPNTSLMIVTDGDKRYEVRITSTEQKNAMIRFRFKKQLP